ncbi:MAG: hypothetical protein A2W03_13360 [Candidatus Aminicenantes bacterium RBG_16_63_16]|nr:MAG: hypothetical protein A2W03_13360 [Candidatus Aminicenantes bacterium RBG_16_63_16]
MNKRTVRKFWLLIFALAAISAGMFGIVQKLSVEQMTQMADSIVLGDVVNLVSQWEDTGAGRNIYTYVTIDANQYIKGSGNRTVMIKVPGGQVGDITQVVTDTPGFTLGEKTIVFLQQKDFPVVGWHQGKFTVVGDKILGLGANVNDFIGMIQIIQQESGGPLTPLPVTGSAPSGENLKAPETPRIGTPRQAVLPINLVKTGIPADEEEEPAKDSAGQAGPPVVNAGWTTIMTETFEGIFPSSGWTVLGDPTWDDDDWKPHVGYWSAWCANGGASGLNPQYNYYPNNMDAWLIYGPFDLSDAVDAELLFYYWNKSESGHDEFQWYSSADGIHFIGWAISGDSGGWQLVNFDLSNRLGDSSVWIAFKFVSDASVVMEGAYVDDIVLQKTLGPNLTPYQPAGWSDKIVVSTHTGDHLDDAPLTINDTLYVDWAVLNNGSAPTEATFYSRLYVDGIDKGTWWTAAPLNAGYYSYASDFSIGSLTAGSHTVQIVVDYDARITETNEGDNQYTKTITVSGVPQITSLSPTIGSAGTGTPVIVYGSNFGTAQGTSNVEFFYRSGQPKIAAPISSWTNTQINCQQVPTGLVSGYPASSSSGPVTVTTGVGTSNAYTFKVTFGYGGVKWTGTHPYVLYEINENTADTTGEGAAVIAGANTWNNVGAKYSFIYNGSTSATNYSYNGHNEVMWASAGAGTLGFTVYWYSGTQIVECDLVFNDYYTWGTTGAAGIYDIWNIATHELGHWLNLRDLYGDIGDGVYDTAKTMYGYGSAGETQKRTLHADDTSGILWIYTAGGDAWDPSDNTGPGATALTPTTVEQSHGRHTLSSADLYDWYVIPMTAGTRFEFYSTCDFPVSSASGDTYGELYSDSGGVTRVAYDDDSGGNLQFHLNYTAATTQSYYLRVRAYNAGSFWSGFLKYLYRVNPTISGHIQTAGGTAIAGVVMNGLPGTPQTDASGNYTGTVTFGWSGTVTPAKTGYTFSPISRSYSNVTTNQTNQDYTGTLPASPIISGHIQTSGGTPIAGVAMNGLPGTPQTDAGGDYTGTVTYGWSGTVTPTKAGHTFSPVSRSYSNVTTNQTNQDYTGTPPASVLIIDVDGNLNSGPAINSAAQGNGYLTTYATSFPASISPANHPMVFVCLGVFSNNHVLSAVEGAALKSYLDAGGRLYMEGGDTWSYDAPTTVHPYFGIAGAGSGSGDLGTVGGAAWTFTQGLSFAYGGDNSSIDHLAVEGGVNDAFVIWNNQSPAYHSGIVRSFGNYRTIGVSFEFGGIPAASRNSIMHQYLDFLMRTGDPVTSSIVADLGTMGLWLWNSSIWSQMSGVNADGMVVGDTDGDSYLEVIGDFGSVGVWLRDNGTWSQLTGANVESMIAADTDGDNAAELVCDFGSIGVWQWDSGAWTQFSGVNVESMLAANTDVDGAEEIFCDFGGLGVWFWNGGSWTQLTGTNAKSIVAPDIDGDGTKDFAGDFGGPGIWIFNNGIWNQITGSTADKLIAIDTDGNGTDEILGDFGAVGLWRWNSGTWGEVWGSDHLYITNAEDIAAANIDADAGDELMIDRGAAGLWLWDSGVLSQVSADNAENLAAADIDLDGQEEIVADLGALGLWVSDEASGVWSWTRITTANAEGLVCGDVRF